MVSLTGTAQVPEGPMSAARSGTAADLGQTNCRSIMSSMSRATNRSTAASEKPKGSRTSGFLTPNDDCRKRVGFRAKPRRHSPAQGKAVRSGPSLSRNEPSSPKRVTDPVSSAAPSTSQSINKLTPFPWNARPMSTSMYSYPSKDGATRTYVNEGASAPTSIAKAVIFVMIFECMVSRFSFIKGVSNAAARLTSHRRPGQAPATNKLRRVRTAGDQSGGVWAVARFRWTVSHSRLLNNAPPSVARHLLMNVASRGFSFLNRHQSFSRSLGASGPVCSRNAQASSPNPNARSKRSATSPFGAARPCLLKVAWYIAMRPKAFRAAATVAKSLLVGYAPVAS